MYVAGSHLFAQKICRWPLLAVVGWKVNPWCLQLISNMATVEPAREKSLLEYRKKLLEHKEVESRLKESMHFAVLLIILQKYCWITHSNVDVVYTLIA